MADIYRDNLIFEISANNPTGSYLQSVSDVYQTKEYSTFPVVTASEGIANKYIVPDKALAAPLLSLVKRPINTSGVTITIGFRTPAVINAANNATSFLFDFGSVGFSGYYFYRADSRKIGMRTGTTDLFTQIDYDFQPSTDYHLVFQFKNGNNLLYVNGVLSGSGTTNVNSMYFEDSIRLFTNPRYGSTPYYSSRFYYMYVFDLANATTVVPADPYFLTPGFKERTVSVYSLDALPVTTKTVPNTIQTANERIFTYVVEGQVTFNSVVKHKHPSNTFIQLINVINQTVLETTTTAEDGRFKIYTNNIPKSSQLLAVDISGEYNTQILQMKL